MDGETNVCMTEVHSLSNQVRINSEAASKHIRCTYIHIHTCIYIYRFFKIQQIVINHYFFIGCVK